MKKSMIVLGLMALWLGMSAFSFADVKGWIDLLRDYGLYPIEKATSVAGEAVRHAVHAGAVAKDAAVDIVKHVI